MAIARPSIPVRALDVFIDGLAEGMTVREACRSANVGYRTMYDYRRDDPEFAARWDSAREESVDRLEAEAQARAMDRTDPDSAKLLTFLLRGRRRQVFGEKVQHEHSGAVGLVVADIEAARAAGLRDPEAMARAAAAMAQAVGELEPGA